MTAPPAWVAEKLYKIDPMARLAWIDMSDKPRSFWMKYLRILDNKEEVEYGEEREDKKGHFALVKLVPKAKLADEDWWNNDGRIFDKHGASKVDWGNRLSPFRVANITSRDVFSGRVCWYLERWNIPLRLRLLEDLDKQEKIDTRERGEITGAMAEEWEYERNKSDYRSTIQPATHDEAEFKYDQARANGDVDTSGEGRIARDRQAVKESFKNDGTKS